MLKDYVEVINNILVAFDPEAIIYNEDAQADEYISESRLINEKINAYMSIEEVSEICKDVFDIMFASDHSAEDFTQIAEEILKEI